MTQLADPPASETTPEPAETDTHGAQPPFDVPAEAAVVPTAEPEAAETAPGPESAAGAADAGVTPVPESEKVGSRTISYEEQERHLQEIEEAERVVAAREEEWEELKAETKTAKDAFDASVEKLRKVIRSHKPGADPLFDGVKERPKADFALVGVSGDEAPALVWTFDAPDKRWDANTATGLCYADEPGTPETYWIHDDQGMGAFDADDELFAAAGITEPVVSFESVDAAKAFAQEIENKIWAARQAPPAEPPAPAADDAWRAVPLDSLKPEIPPKKLEILAQHNPPITTMGELADWQEKKGDWWWRDIKGLGEKGMTAVVESQDAFFLTKREAAGKERRTYLERHGQSYTPEYTAWKNMIRRCSCPTAQAYPFYGGRGIKVCEAWADSFEAFIADMGPRPSADHSIERLDNDGNYEPGNCVWATQEEQNRNRSNTARYTFYGVEKTIGEWSKETGISVANLHYRIKKGWPHEQVFSQEKLPGKAIGRRSAHEDASDQAVVDQAEKVAGADEPRSLNNPDHSADDFTEDSIDQSTREVITDTAHLKIEVARRTSGPWQDSYFLSIGKLERSKLLGSGCTYGSRDLAVNSAVTVVADHMERANGVITSKKDLATAREVRAALEAARPTA